MKIKLNVKSRVAAVFAVMGILLAFGVGAATYTLSYRQVAAQYSGSALSSARMAAAIVEALDIDGYLTQGSDPEYDSAYQSLQELKTAYGLTYLYIVRPDISKNNGIYIFDVYTGDNDLTLIAGLGEPTGEIDVYDIVLETYLTGHSQNSAIITNTEFGYLASAYAPVYAADGSITAVAGADISMNVILRDVRAQTLQIAGATLGIISLFMVILLIIIQQRILTPVVRLSRHMEGFDSKDGGLKEFNVMRTGDELQVMAESFNRMTGDILIYIENLAIVTADRERIATELDIATRIQASMLPCIFPPFPNRAEFDIYASMQSAKEVGGDFYDFFLLDDNTLAVVIADVSGKGVPAALFMVIAKTLIKNNAQYGKSPKEVFETVNNLLCENNDAGMFVTAFMGYLDIPSGKFAFVNAGHNPPLLRLGDKFDWLRTKPGFVLGGTEDMSYKQYEVSLSLGDELFLYTDGVTEATDMGNRLFGNTRLLEAVNSYPHLPLKEFTETLKREIDIFAGGAQQADDITMLALRYKGENTI